MRRAAPPQQEPPFAWSAVSQTADVALLGAKEITEYAPPGSSPTSLLNHETSDHLLSRLKAKSRLITGAQDLRSPPVLQSNVNRAEA